MCSLHNWGVFMWCHIKQILQSHHTCDPHVGFLFTCEGIGKSNKRYHYILFSSYNITKLPPSANTHTRIKFQILSWSKSKVLVFFVVFLHTALCKRKPRDFENRARISAYRVVQTLHYEIGLITLAISPYKSYKLTGLQSVATNHLRQSLNEKQHAWLYTTSHKVWTYCPWERVTFCVACFSLLWMLCGSAQ